MKRTLWLVEFFGDVEDKTYVAYSLKQFTEFLLKNGKVRSIKQLKLDAGKAYRFYFRQFPFYIRVIPGKVEINPYFLKDVWITYEIPPLEKGISAFPVFDTELWVVVKNEVQ